MKADKLLKECNSLAATAAASRSGSEVMPGWMAVVGKESWGTTNGVTVVGWHGVAKGFSLDRGMGDVSYDDRAEARRRAAGIR